MISGVAAVPVMGVMMVGVSLRSAMGEHTASLALRIFGWLATAVMAAAAVAMVVV